MRRRASARRSMPTERKAGEMSTAEPSTSISFMHAARRWSMLLLALGTLLLVLSAIGFWVQWSLMRESNFVSLSTGVLTSEATRGAIARGVVDIVFAEHPILRALIRNPLEAVIAGLLDTTVVRASLEFVAQFIWQTLFVNQTSVVLDIEPLQNFIYGIVSALNPELAASLAPQDLPSQIVLVDGSDLPDIEAISNWIVWLTLLFLLLGAGLIAFVVARAWSVPQLRWALLGWTGVILAVEAVLVFVISIPARSTVVLAIGNPTGRIVVGETYDELFAQLEVVLAAIFILGVLLIGLCFFKRDRLEFMQRRPQPVDEPETPLITEPALAPETAG